MDSQNVLSVSSVMAVGRWNAKKNINVGISRQAECYNLHKKKMKIRQSRSLN